MQCDVGTLWCVWIPSCLFIGRQSKNPLLRFSPSHSVILRLTSALADFTLKNDWFLKSKVSNRNDYVPQFDHFNLSLLILYKQGGIDVGNLALPNIFFKCWTKKPIIESLVQHLAIQGLQQQSPKTPCIGVYIPAHHILNPCKSTNDLNIKITLLLKAASSFQNPLY